MKNLLETSKKIFEEKQYEREIDDLYDRLMRVLHGEIEDLKNIKVIEIDEQESPDDKKLEIKIEYPPETPRKEKETLMGLWYVMRKELEKVNQNQDSQLEDIAKDNKIELKLGNVTYQAPTEKEEIKTEKYTPRYLSQVPIIQGLTGSSDADILETAKKNYMADWLLNYVCRFYGEDEQDILSPRKFRNLVLVRGVYSYFMHRKLKYSLPQIGRRVGNRDHTTILGVIRKIEGKMKMEPNFMIEVENLWRKGEGEFTAFVKQNNKQLQASGTPTDNN
jgi:hypothetical protein